MTPNMTRIFAVAALYTAAVSAQEASAPEVAVRAVRVERPQEPKKDGRQARMVMLVEKLASGELTEVERAECRKMLLDLVRADREVRRSTMVRRPGVAKVRKLDGEDVEVTVEVVEQGGDDERRVRWRRNEAKPIDVEAAPRRVRAGRLLPGSRLPELYRAAESESGGGEMVRRYRALEQAKKAHEEALRAHEEAMKEHGRALEAHEQEIHRLRKVSPGKEGAGRYFTFEVDGGDKIEGLGERIAEALEEVRGAAEVEYEVLYHDEHGELGRTKARARKGDGPQVGVVVQGRGEPEKGGTWIVKRGDGGERAVFEWLREEHEEHGHHEREHEEHGHHEREHEERGHHEREHEEHGHHEREHEEQGHHEREHEEHGHHEREHEEHGHHERDHDEHGHDEHDDHEDELAEAAEELFEMIEEMREEIRELREMVEELHHALHERDEREAPRREGRRRGERPQRRGR